MKLEEALLSALAYENRVRDVYREAARNPAIRRGREFFQMMADEEQGHVEFLESKLVDIRKRVVIETEAVASRIPPAAYFDARKAELRIEHSEPEPSTPEAAVELRLLEEALQVEEATSAHYGDLVNGVDEPNRSVFERFLEIEMDHRAFVQFQIDMILGTGAWFELDDESGW